MIGTSVGTEGFVDRLPDRNGSTTATTTITRGGRFEVCQH